MDTNYRTEADVQRKGGKIFRGVATVIFFLILSMLYANFPSTYFFDYQQRSGTGWDIFSFVFFTVAVGVLWLGNDIDFLEKKPILQGVIIVGALALCILCAAGFDFSLRGIEK